MTTLITERRKPLSTAKALTCLFINIFATPGLGSLLGRRLIAGTGQILLALAGFGLLAGWIFEYSRHLILTQLDKPPAQGAPDWLWQWGLIYFGAGWLWSLITSIGLLRQAKAEEQTAPGRIPPRIPDSDPPGSGAGG